MNIRPRDVGAELFRASSSRYGFTSVTTTWRAPAWRTMAAAMQPIGPAPVISTSSPSTSNAERSVHGIAERIEERDDLASGSCRVGVPDVRHRQGDVFGEAPVRYSRRCRSCARRGGGGRPGNCGTARRRRVPRR